MNTRRRYAGLLALSIGLVLAVAACGDPTPTPTATAAVSLDSAMEDEKSPAGPGVVFRVYPEILNWPVVEHSQPLGVWFYGSGLEPGKWFLIFIEDGDLRREEPVHYGTPGALLRQADEDGSFAVALGIPGSREGRDALSTEMIQAPTTPLTVRLVDGDTREVLATVPWLVCGLDRNAPWCPIAQDLVPLLPAPEVVVLAAGSVYMLDSLVAEDGKFELRMGAESYWGYAAESRPVSLGDGIIMNVRVGDTIHFDQVRMSGSRSTKDHHLTIESLGIDIDLGASNVEPFELGPFTEPGEHIIDDGTHPGEHGVIKIVVAP